MIFLFKNKRYKLTIAGKAALLIGSLLISFIIGELLVRKCVKVPLEEKYLIFRCFGYAEIPEHKRDQDLLWRPRDISSKYSKHKDADCFRIICLGDSVTVGYEKRGPLPVKQTYPYKLENLLRSRFKGKNIEIINAGSGGHSSLQGMRYLKKTLCEYKPDLVISWHGINDQGFMTYFTDKQQKVSLIKAKQTKSEKNTSKLYLLVKDFCLRKGIFKKEIPRVSVEEYYANCEQMINIARENNFEIVFIVPFEVDLKKNSIKSLKYKQCLEDLQEKYGCIILYPGEYLRPYEKKKIFIDLCHPNENGNQVIAEIMDDLLSDLLDKMLSRKSNEIDSRERALFK